MLKQLLFAAILAASANLFAATYYVDSNNGNDSNAGTSEAAAWSTISKVNGMTFAPGDNILFKRGSTWFNTTLVVSSSGTSSAPIVYGSYGIGDLPVIDGTRTLQNDAMVDGKSYVTIQEIKFQNATGEGTLRIQNSTGNKVQNCEFFVTAHGGVFLQNTTDVIISKNKITTPVANLNIQTDGIYTQRTNGTIVDGNNITISNSNVDQHCDGYQSFQDANVTARNNYIVQDNLKTYNAQGIYLTEGTGTDYFYNNVIKCPNTKASTLGYENLTTNGTTRSYNNTLITGGTNGLSITNDPGAVAKNNIIIGLGSNPPVTFTVKPAAGNLNNNIYFGTTSSIMYMGGTVYTFAQLQSMGYESSGKNVDPMLNDDGTAKAGSPAIDAGADIGGVYDVDIMGTSRPQGNGTDIGAYEYKNSGTPVSSITTSIKGGSNPNSYELAQNFPNPFNPSTVIKYSLPKNTEVSVKVYNILGQQVAELFNGVQNAGSYQLTFNAANLASGTYIYMIKTNDFTETKKMQLIK